MKQLGEQMFTAYRWR